MIICYTAENGKFVDLLKRTDIYLTLFLWVRNQGVTQLGGSVSGSLRRLQSRSQPGFGGPAPRVHSQGWRQAASAPHLKGCAVGLLECPQHGGWPPQHQASQKGVTRQPRAFYGLVLEVTLLLLF